MESFWIQIWLKMKNPLKNLNNAKLRFVKCFKRARHMNLVDLKKKRG